jgi:hypothetical protein
MATDPVCFAIVDEETAQFRAMYGKGVLFLHEFLQEAIFKKTRKSIRASIPTSASSRAAHRADRAVTPGIATAGYPSPFYLHPPLSCSLINTDS